MAGYQYTIIIGNVGRDPEIRYLDSGVAVCSFSVAVTERWNDRQTNERREKTTWFRVTAWRGLAETCNQYVRKGMQIMVTGAVSASAYTNQAGEPTATLEITARDVQFLGGRDGQGGSPYEDDFAPPPSSVDDIPF
ncbi:MAG: single-stranded DNA-binding protein [Chloroflexi bacterium]|nr:MAG: single-stranded DNA-binding protein [Chloroflexota bacterium]